MVRPSSSVASGGPSVCMRAWVERGLSVGRAGVVRGWCVREVLDALVSVILPPDSNHPAPQSLAAPNRGATIDFSYAAFLAQYWAACPFSNSAITVIIAAALAASHFMPLCLSLSVRFLHMASVGPEPMS